MSTSACWRRSCSRACSTPCATRVSLDPLARNTAKPTTSLAVQPGPRARLAGAIAQDRDIVEPRPAAVGQCDGRRAQRLHAGGAAERAYRLLGAGKRGAAAGDVGVGAQQLRVDLVRAQPQCLQPVGAQGDPDFALHPAQALHLLHAGHGQQFPADHIVDEPRDVDQAQGLGADRVVQDGAALDIDAGDDGFLDRLGQVGADLRDGIADVIGGPAGLCPTGIPPS